MPTVVAGSLYASSQGLSCIDRDQTQLGRLLANYLLSKGHRKILMITRQRPGLGAGDYRVADAIAEIASGEGLSANALIVRSLPHDPVIVRGEIQHFLETCDDLPGILLRPWQMIEPIYEAIEAAGLTPQKDVAVAVADYFQGTSKPLPYPAIRSTMTPKDQGFQWGQLLLESARNGSANSKSVLVPVRLEIPAELS
ncbi:LacI family transcriptional regulator [Blastopirellula marina]|uniref:Selenocysteine synthase n=1 Tax=Blastopirellula marina DSM 3645 TaxID=314230 RepID=A3ZQ69_9BACT|nr:LacI family transcriptional regulator [Blastopirellula marina]EAQ81342.1 selenocysteine synthase [Blastopirellula marina DSM 3645]